MGGQGYVFHGLGNVQPEGVRTFHLPLKKGYQVAHLGHEGAGHPWYVAGIPGGISR